MNILPVIRREFTACSRRPSTYYLRVFAAGGLAVAAAYYFFDFFTTPTLLLSASVGFALFQRLNQLAVLFLMAACVVLVAPSLGQEKRDGTLGLLFLTPLGAREIVIAKTLFFALFVFSAWLAFLPVMNIPMLLGGVTAADAGGAICQSLNAILAALAGGMLAASFCASRAQSIVGGVVFALLFLGLTNLIHVFLLSPVALRLLMGSLGPGQSTSPWTPSGHAWVWAATLGVSLLLLGASLLCSAAILRRSWHERPLTARQLRWRTAFTTPRFALSWYRRKMRRALWHNPIGWLHQHSWKARLLKWGWVFVVGMILSNGTSRSRAQDSLWIVGALGATMAFAAVNSFQRERVSGVMELILVAPLSPEQIILGRLKGIWGQFLPAALLWLGFEQVLAGWALQPLSPDAQAFFLFAATVFLCVPVIGLRCSLLPLPMIANWIITLALVAAAPVLAMVASDSLIQYCGLNYAWFALEFRIWVTIPCGIASLLAVSLLAHRELRRILHGRRFRFSRQAD